MNVLRNTIQNLMLYDTCIENGSLVELYKKDMVGFFSYLSKGDSFIKAKELEYINKNLMMSLSKEDIKRINKEEKRSLLDRYKDAMGAIYSSIFQKRIPKKEGEDLIQKIGMTYKVVGTDFLAADDTVKESEIKRLTNILKDIDITLHAYLDEIYDEEDEDLEPEECIEDEEITLEDALEELDSLVGLETVKYEIHNLIQYVRIRELRKERGLSVLPISYHVCFTGNPGTGKTTVARIFAKLLYILGIVKENKVIEVSRADLVGGYIGQTAIKTQEVLDTAIGGVLFIDEAYSLTYKKTGGDYGLEAVETLIKSMEDNRDNLIVIFAGYKEPMCEFIASNPGLKSRVNRYIDFEDYSSEELFEILDRLCEKNEYMLDEKASIKSKEYLKELKEQKDESFGNGREVRNLFERIIANQANRLARLDEISNEELARITEEDIY